MATMDWVTRARQFLNNDLLKLKSARSDLELRVAVMDAHAVLENTLRGYLAEVEGIEGMFDKSKMSFRGLVHVLRNETGDSVLNAQMADSVLAFNTLRNHVVHDGYYPSHEQVQAGVTLSAHIVKTLIGEASSVPAWQAPFHFVAGRLGGDFTYRLGVMLIMFSILYIINPIDIPGPLDDVGITAPCIFSAAMLINAARMVRRKSSGKK